MTHITSTLLRKYNACSRQVSLFTEIFGESAELNQKNWTLAIEKELDVLWFLNVLPCNKRKEYLKIRQPAYEEYLKIEQPACEEYLKIQQPAWEEYLKIQQPAWEEYLKIQQPAYEEYLKICRAKMFELLVSL